MQQKLFSFCSYTGGEDGMDSGVCKLPAIDLGQGAALCEKHTPATVSNLLTADSADQLAEIDLTLFVVEQIQARLSYSCVCVRLQQIHLF